MSDDKNKVDEWETQGDASDFMMVNSLIRIAKDLERLLIAASMCAGLLGLIAGLMLYRLLIGR